MSKHRNRRPQRTTNRFDHRTNATRSQYPCLQDVEEFDRLTWALSSAQRRAETHSL